MDTKGITLVGLGPGDPFLLTRQAWDILEKSSEIYLRTRHHPCVDFFPDQWRFHSFDYLYQQEDSFEAVYEKIISRVIELGQRPQGVVYAVPGNPMIAEATSPEILLRARQADIPVQIVPGISFIEPVFSALGLDPFPRTFLVDALWLASAHVPLFPPDTPALIAQIYSRLIASDVKLTLMEVYPDDHPVILVHAAGTSDCRVEHLPLHAIDHSADIGLLSALYVPPLSSAVSFEAFQEIIAHLRSPEGCPWDREQTHLSLRANLIEEAYEVLQALDSEDPHALCEELGDLLLQIVLHAQIANEYGEFRMADVIREIHAKIVRRHPHVFGGAKAANVGDVLQNWENLKSAEREANNKTQQGILDGVARALPALAQAEQYLSRAARTGFQWPEMQDALAKVHEEIQEVQRAETMEEKVYEIGDLLMAMVNLALFHGVDPESALRQANLRFKKRFSFLEQAVRTSGRTIADLSIEEMLSLWNEAKHSEK